MARWNYIILFITILLMLTIFLCCLRTVGIVWTINDGFGKTVITTCTLQYIIIPIHMSRYKRKLLYFFLRGKLQLIRFFKKSIDISYYIFYIIVLSRDIPMRSPLPIEIYAYTNLQDSKHSKHFYHSYITQT